VPSGDWIEAMRMERWADAARGIDALAEPDRKRATVRYARARAASALADHAATIRELDGLDKDLPLLAAEIERRRALSELEVGPFDSAARYFSRGRAPSSLVNAAIAYERGADLPKARAAADRALLEIDRLNRQSKRPDVALEAQARSTRARIAEKQGHKTLAAADLRWIATLAPTTPEAQGLDARLETLAPGRALTKRERYERAMSMAREGLVERTDQELGLITKAPGTAIKEGELVRARGWALYMARTDYPRAAELLEQSSRFGGEHAVSDLFHAARARSRAHDDQRAIVMYESLAQRHPGSSFAEQASFLAARLRYILGQWDDAARGYERYLARHKKLGRFLEASRYELAVASLAGKKYDRAAKAFAALAAEADETPVRVRYLELEGVALAAASKKDLATERFRRVIRDQPLSFAALASAARLDELGQPLPPPIAPPEASASSPSVEIELPARARLLMAIGLDGDAENELAGAEEAIRKRYAPRGDEALCRAYGKLATAAQRYRTGQKAARWSDLDNAPSAQSRWLWECVYPKPYESVVRDVEREWKLPPDFIYAVMRQESAFRTGAESPAQAVGLLQLIPPTARQVTSELSIRYDPALLKSPPDNIRLGSYYLKKMLDTFGGELPLAAAAYNAGPTAVSRWLETGENLPLDVWVARIPFEETRTYVHRVLGNYARYAYLAGGESAVPKLALAVPKGLRAPAGAY
jgi:soluble lytic murein transglycosylase